MADKNPLAKVIDFVPLGILSGPGAPDPDLGISWYSDSWYFTHVFEKEAESQELLKKRDYPKKMLKFGHVCGNGDDLVPSGNGEPSSRKLKII